MAQIKGFFKRARINCTHTNVTSQTIIYPNPNPNPKYRSRIPKPNTLVANSRKGGLFVGLVLGLGILD